MYVHVLDAPDSALLLPPLGARVRSARILTAGRAAEFSEHDFGVVVKLPGDAIDPIDTIVELVLGVSTIAITLRSHPRTLNAEPANAAENTAHVAALRNALLIDRARLNMKTPRTEESQSVFLTLVSFVSSV